MHTDSSTSPMKRKTAWYLSLVLDLIVERHGGAHQETQQQRQHHQREQQPEEVEVQVHARGGDLAADHGVHDLETRTGTGGQTGSRGSQARWRLTMDRARLGRLLCVL